MSRTIRVRERILLMVGPALIYAPLVDLLDGLGGLSPSDVIAVVAIVASASLAVAVVRLQVKAGREDALAERRRGAHLRFWTQANAWLRQLQQARAGEAVRPAEGDLLDRQRDTHAAFREVEIVSPAVLDLCSRVVTALDLAHADLRTADDHGTVKPGSVDERAATVVALDNDIEAARQGLSQLLHALRAFNETARP